LPSRSSTSNKKALNILHGEMQACRRCLEAGFSIVPGAIFSGPVTARVMVVGQAPGITEMEAQRPFNASSGRRLFQWLAEAGWDEDDFRATQYMTAITKCYPGKSPGGKGDRAPSHAEQELCAPFLERELALVQPEVIIPVGRLAIQRFLGQVLLDDVVGSATQDEAGRWIVPLPHPSGASLWLNKPEHQALGERAIERLRESTQAFIPNALV
jgi:uracil-DNA glycosylase